MLSLLFAGRSQHWEAHRSSLEWVCAGIVGMCKEHFGVALALKVPVLFLVTKVDICPDHVLQHTLSALHSILRKPGVKKKPYMVRWCSAW